MKKAQAEELAAAIRKEVGADVQVEVQPEHETETWRVYVGGEMRVWFKGVIEWREVKAWLEQNKKR